MRADRYRLWLSILCHAEEFLNVICFIFYNPQKKKSPEKIDPKNWIFEFPLNDEFKNI
jgi:hypothetical protein